MTSLDLDDVVRHAAEDDGHTVTCQSQGRSLPLPVSRG